MLDQPIFQLLILLAAAVLVVAVFQRLHVPTSLGYLAVGVVLGPYTPGPVIEGHQLRVLAEFGIVFLLFTIGLSFTLPRIHAMRDRVLALGTGQVLLTTFAVGLLAWAVGLPPAAAFVVGAVFAQSSTTIIGRQLAEQGEEDSRHGRMGLAMSVFQDVTAVPFVVVIPVLGVAVGAAALGMALATALAKAVLAFVLVYLAGRWVMRPLFHAVASGRSFEIFTLAVLLVALAAGWTTQSLGLAMPFGAFLAGMMLGETEFRHQVESAIRPFRDVLLGLFFVGVGMLFDLTALPQIWPWALGGALLLMSAKTLLVFLLLRRAGEDSHTALRTGLLLAVGGEFGFALLALAVEARVMPDSISQVALAAVLISMMLAPLLIRYNRVIAERLLPSKSSAAVAEVAATPPAESAGLADHVIICGYGRIGQGVAQMLVREGFRYVAVDLEPARVREAHMAGEPVYFGDATERGVLESLGLQRARLVLVSHHDQRAAQRLLRVVRDLRPDLPVLARTTDEHGAGELRRLGATEVVPETLEAALMIAANALLLLGVAPSRVLRRVREQRNARYPLLHELIRGDDSPLDVAEEPVERLHPVVLEPGHRAVGLTLGEIELPGVEVTALVRSGIRRPDPSPETVLAAGDALVLLGTAEAVGRAERRLRR